MATDAPPSEQLVRRYYDHPTLPYRYAFGVSRTFEARVLRDLERFEKGLGQVGLVSCSNEKLECRAPARDLYRSPLFRKAARVCEAMHMDWGILSAKHGLVLPDQVLDPYDVSFHDLSRDERTAWAVRTRKQIVQRWGERRHLWIYAGRVYLAAVRGLYVMKPLGRKGVGDRLKKLNEDLEYYVPQAIHGRHAWTFREGDGTPIPGGSAGGPTAALAFSAFTQFYPVGWPWEAHYTTRSIPTRKEISTHYVCTGDDPIMFRRRIFAKASGLTLPHEPEWLTSVTPELERS